MDDTLKGIVEVASGAVGVDFAHYREPMIRRRIAHRQRLRACADESAYAALLRDDPAERWRLADSLLIKTTRAFRHAPTWDAVRHIALPRLIARCVHRGCTTLSAWVAGCSTGEEAYSYAMAMLDARDRAAVELGVRVFATDVDLSALEHAVRGSYSAAAFSSTPRELAERYLRTDAAQNVIVRDELRAVVAFSRHDVTSDAAISHSVFASFDLVSCCNVLLYFDDATRRQALWRLLESCEPHGVLVLGEAEYPPSDFALELVAIASGAHAFDVTPRERMSNSPANSAMWPARGYRASASG